MEGTSANCSLSIIPPSYWDQTNTIIGLNKSCLNCWWLCNTNNLKPFHYLLIKHVKYTAHADVKKLFSLKELFTLCPPLFHITIRSDGISFVWSFHISNFSLCYFNLFLKFLYPALQGHRMAIQPPSPLQWSLIFKNVQNHISNTEIGAEKFYLKRKFF